MEGINKDNSLELQEKKKMKINFLIEQLVNQDGTNFGCVYNIFPEMEVNLEELASKLPYNWTNTKEDILSEHPKTVGLINTEDIEDSGDIWHQIQTTNWESLDECLDEVKKKEEED
jgi:hypothetical protein